LSPEDQTTERLNAAIDALIRGTPLAEACADLPNELHPLATAGARLAALRVAAPDSPRPGFLLSLEEQLRADLRLGQGSGPSDPPTRTPSQPPSAGPLPPPAETPPASLSRSAARRWAGRGIVVGLVLTGLVGLYRGAERAGPEDTLYPAKRGIEAVRLFAAFSPEAKAQVCLDVGWRRLEEAGQALRSGRTIDLADMVEDMTTAYTLALTFAEQSDDRRMANLAQSETELAVGELGRLAAQADPRAAALLRNVNLVLSGTGKGRKIVAVTAPSATATAGPTQVVAMPPASPAPASPTTEPGVPPAAPSAEPTAPATAQPPASPSPELPPGPNASATPPVTARPPASPTLAPTALPTTAVPPPPSATRIKPKPQPPTATRTAAPPSEPTRTPKPWATEPEPNPTAPPPRPSATPEAGPEPPPTEAPSAEPPTAGPPIGPGQP